MNEVVGVRFAVGGLIPADNRREAILKAERAEQPDRQIRLLVCTYAQPRPVGEEAVEGVRDAGKGRREPCDVGRVGGDIAFRQAIQSGRIRFHPACRESAHEEVARTKADPGAHITEGGGR